MNLDRKVRKSRERGHEERKRRKTVWVPAPVSASTPAFPPERHCGRDLRRKVRGNHHPSHLLFFVAGIGTSLQSRFPGTKMKRAQMAASTRATSSRTMRARLVRSDLTKGSRMREKEKNVYSL